MPGRCATNAGEHAEAIRAEGVKARTTRGHGPRHPEPRPGRHVSLLVVFLVTIKLVGCATAPPEPEVAFAAQPRLAECTTLFGGLDQLVHDNGVADVQAARIRGFPFLRVNRFLASYAADLNNNVAFAAWVERLRRLDQEGREAEIANLPSGALRRAAGLPRSKLALDREVERCGISLQRHLLSAPQYQPVLRKRAQVPAAYRMSQRVFGLYPLSSLFVYEGVKRVHADSAREFSIPLSQLPVEGALVRYAPTHSAAVLAPAEVRKIIARASDNPLGIPEPLGQDRIRLLSTFAPIWEVDVTGDFDRLGMPRQDPSLGPTIDVERAVTFAHVSYARWHTRPLLQLNYIVWFPERPRSGAFDLLGGRLDGITWRVTLGHDGLPLVYDTMHNCGCYHMFFPTARVRVKEPRPVYEEPLLVPQQLAASTRRVVLRIATRTHYLRRVYTIDETVEDQTYAVREYSELRSLPLVNGGRRSLFRPNGLVPLTERAERWLLWPMGIPEPGAMRQRGHHATAFIGRRHFDEPDLLGRYFDVLPAYR
jgi:hypothetical protein